MSSFCGQCGMSLDAGKGYCPNCGAASGGWDAAQDHPGVPNPDATVLTDRPSAGQPAVPPAAPVIPVMPMPPLPAAPPPGLSSHYGFTGPSTSGLAIAAMVTGISSLPLYAACLMGAPASIAAIVLGHLARRQIRRSGGMKSGSGMALAGLIIGYITLALFVAGCVVVLILAISESNKPSSHYTPYGY